MFQYLCKSVQFSVCEDGHYKKAFGTCALNFGAATTNAKVSFHADDLDDHPGFFGYSENDPDYLVPGSEASCSSGDLNAARDGCQDAGAVFSAPLKPQQKSKFWQTTQLPKFGELDWTFLSF